MMFPPASPGALSLRANFLWTFFGNGAYALSQWGILILLAKTGTVGTVGQFSLGLAVTAPVMLFCGLNLRAVQATDAKDEYRFSAYLGLRLVTVVFALAVVGAIAGLGQFRTQTAVLILVLGAAKAFESISDVIYGLLQKRERMDRIGVSLAARGLLSLAVMAVVLWITGDIVWAAVGMAMTWALWLLAYDVSAARAFDTARPSFRGQVLWGLVRLALPLGFVMLLVSLISNVPRYYIQRCCGETELGYFSALAYLMMIGSTVVGALGQSASPRLARLFAEGQRRRFLALVLKLLGIAVVLGMLGIALAVLAGRQILGLLYAPEYGEHVALFVWLMVAALVSFVAALLGYAITAQRRFREQVVLFVVVVAVLVGACTLLVPHRGTVGAAQATLIAGCVQACGAAVIGVRALRLMARG